MAQTLTTADSIRRIIVEHLGVDPYRVTPEAHIIDDLGANSLDTVELVMELEAAFGIDVPDARMEDVKTVADVVALVEGLIPARIAGLT